MVFFRLWTLIIKELQVLFRNKASLRALIVPIVLQSLIFPSAATLELTNSTLIIFDQDQSAFSIEFTQRLGAASAFPEVLHVYSLNDLQTAIDEQRALIAIRIPLNFKQILINNEKTSIQAIIDGRHANSAQIAFTYVAQILQEFMTEQGMGSSPVTLNTHHFYNSTLNFKWFQMPSLIAIIVALGTLTVTALSLAREREEGTYDQLLVSPLTPFYIMVGKGIPAIIIAISQGTIITLVAIFVYGVPFTGSIGLYYFCMICYAFSLVGVGLFVSAFSSTQQQAFLGVFFFMIPAVVLSGFMAPIENMPPVLYWLAQLNPMTHYIIIVKGILLKGYTMPEAWPHIWPILVMSVIMFFIIYCVFSKKNKSQ